MRSAPRSTSWAADSGMRLSFAAALALIVPAALSAQVATLDLSAATPVPGNWTYTAAADGSEAVFANPSALPQLWIHCAKATRRVSIAKPATAAAPFLQLWTSSAARGIPASFNPLTNRITAELPAYDPLLDALAFSRGRIGVGVTGLPTLVAPAWPEIARVVEDCRS
jgi:hypothetical protein